MTGKQSGIQQQMKHDKLHRSDCFGVHAGVHTA